ncbi:MAG: hypothetical protein PVS3B1_24000 [Ktedonobacteraceae bacterium]
MLRREGQAALTPTKWFPCLKQANWVDFVVNLVESEKYGRAALWGSLVGGRMRKAGPYTFGHESAGAGLNMSSDANKRT